jgi:hypothetical protein
MGVDHAAARLALAALGNNPTISADVFERRVHEAQQSLVAPVGLRGKPRLAPTFRGKPAPARVGHPELYGAQPSLPQGHSALSRPS